MSLEMTYARVEPLLRTAFILQRYQSNLFFNYAYVKFLWNMAWYLGCDTLCSLGVLRSKILETFWKIVSTVTSGGLGVIFLSTASWDIYGQGYTIQKSFMHPMQSFIPHQQVRAMGVPCMPLSLFACVVQLHVRHVLGEEKMQAENARDFWKPIINKEMGMEVKQQQDAVVAQ